MKLYVAGPMGDPNNTDRWDAAIAVFVYAVRRLRQAGHEIISPHELECNLGDKRGFNRKDNYRRCLPDDIRAIAQCDGIVLLPGFEESAGVSLERHANWLFGGVEFQADDESGTMSLEEWIDRILYTIQLTEEEGVLT